MTTDINTAKTSEAISIQVDVELIGTTTVTTMLGATLQADAIGDRSVVPGVASYIAPLKLGILIPANSLSVGVWNIQLLATPPGETTQVVYAENWVISKGA